MIEALYDVGRSLRELLLQNDSYMIDRSIILIINTCIWSILHFELKLVSVKLEDFGFVFPTFSLGFWKSFFFSFFFLLLEPILILSLAQWILSASHSSWPEPHLRICCWETTRHLDCYQLFGGESGQNYRGVIRPLYATRM
jgi:hypothetical protein